jgi:hypothetical protein
MFPASGLERYLSNLLHICMQVLTLSSLALSSCPYRRVEMELNRQFPSAFTLSGVPIYRPRLCRYITLTVSTGFERRGGRLSETVNAGISSNSRRAAYFSDSKQPKTHTQTYILVSDYSVYHIHDIKNSTIYLNL